MESLPQDPMMLLCVINTKLRDEYASLDNLCEDLDIPRAELEARLHDAGFDYQPQANRFV